VSSGAAPLFELVRYQRELETLADSGEVPVEQIRDTLEALEGDIREKAVTVAQFARNIETSATAIREAGKKMLERADRLERRAESVRAYLTFQMQAAGITRIESPWFTLAVRRNPPSVVVDDESRIPDQFRVQPEPPPPRLDRAAIARALKAGDDVPGAHLVQSERLEVRE